jgi:FKBP-type peptidyl-prolyl cis-trans isomerase FkpA
MKTTYSTLTAAALILAGCTPVPTKDAGKEINPKASFNAAPSGCDQKTESGLGYRMITVGEGKSPGARDKVTINYKGSLAATGAVFDENKDTSFGVGGVIPGFGEGLQLAKPGGSIRLCIPAVLGYGQQASDSIPANSDLVFDVDLLSVAAAPPEVLPLGERACSAKTASGLGYEMLSAGQGVSPTNEHYVLVAYAGYLSTDGTIFDQSDQTAFPVSAVVPGFGEGLKLMNKGAKYRLCIPSALGYGARKTGPIPANSDLVFIVDLLEMKTKAEVKQMQAAQGQ